MTTTIELPADRFSYLIVEYDDGRTALRTLVGTWGMDRMRIWTEVESQGWTLLWGYDELHVDNDAGFCDQMMV